MKIAALYDIHANLPALNALLEELQEVNPDLIVIGGDIVSGPRPVQTLERLYQIDHEVRFIRGNQDREVVMTFDGEPPNPDTQPHDPSLAWVAGQLSPAHRDFLAQLPGEIIIHLEGRGEMLFCHATPRSDEEIFTPVTPEERLTAMFSGVQQRTVICGHTHIQFERLAGGCHILNAGSVGMPFADRRARTGCC